MISDEQFVKVIRDTKLSVQVAADALGVSQPTIRRWAEGKNLPYQAVRRYLVEEISNAEGRA